MIISLEALEKSVTAVLEVIRKAKKESRIPLEVQNPFAQLRYWWDWVANASSKIRYEQLEQFLQGQIATVGRRDPLAQTLLEAYYFAGLSDRKIFEKYQPALTHAYDSQQQIKNDRYIHTKRKEAEKAVAEAIFLSEQKACRNWLALYEAPLRNRPIVGRDQAIADLVQLLSTENFPYLIYLHGLFGIGKSRLIEEVVYRVAESGRFWHIIQLNEVFVKRLILASDNPLVNASADRRILNELIPFLAQKLGLAEKDSSIENIRTEFRLNPTLIVIDGLGPETKFDLLIHPLFAILNQLANPCKIVIVGQKRVHATVSFADIELPSLDEPSVIQLLRSKHQATEKAKTIYALVGGHPAAINLLSGLNQRGSVVLSADPEINELREVRANLYTQYDRLWSVLKSESAERLLCLCLLLAPIPFSPSLLAKLSGMENAMEMIATLRVYHWLETGPEDQLLLLPLTQNYLLDKLRNDPTLAQWYQEALSQGCDYWMGQWGLLANNLGLLEMIYPHLVHLLGVALQKKEKTLWDKSAKCLTNYTLLIEKSSHWNQYVLLLELAVKVTPEENSFILGSLLDDIGCFYRSHHLPTALINYEKALNIAYQHINNPILVARVHINLCISYAYLGDFLSAKEHETKGLEFYLAITNPIERASALTFAYLEIGLSYDKKRYFLQAIDYYRLAKNQTNDASQLAIIHNNWGNSLKCNGQHSWQEAQNHYILAWGYAELCQGGSVRDIVALSGLEFGNDWADSHKDTVECWFQHLKMRLISPLPLSTAIHREVEREISRYEANRRSGVLI